MKFIKLNVTGDYLDEHGNTQSFTLIDWGPPEDLEVSFTHTFDHESVEGNNKPALELRATGRRYFTLFAHVQGKPAEAGIKISPEEAKKVLVASKEN